MIFVPAACLLLSVTSWPAPQSDLEFNGLLSDSADGVDKSEELIYFSEQLTECRVSAGGVRPIGGLQRPRAPPPPAPASAPAAGPSGPLRLANGRSTESLCSVTSETGERPRRHRAESYRPPARRCRAMYDCDADNDDELTFYEGEVRSAGREGTAGEWRCTKEGILLGVEFLRSGWPCGLLPFVVNRRLLDLVIILQ